jgi:GntR family transcriptional regulator, transcriptional repressor for pyruvate dehydrogenase complex
LRDAVEGEADSDGPDLHAWSQGTQQFHDLIIERAGNRTLVVQAGVLREVVSSHLAVTVSRLFDPVQTPEGFRRSIRSYTKLVDLIAASAADGAEKHWRSQHGGRRRRADAGGRRAEHGRPVRLIRHLPGQSRLPLTA